MPKQFACTKISNSSHLCYTKINFLQCMLIVKVHGVFPSSCK